MDVRALVHYTRVVSGGFVVGTAAGFGAGLVADRVVGAGGATPFVTAGLSFGGAAGAVTALVLGDFGAAGGAAAALVAGALAA
jgi:hypothetical protein